MASGGTKYGAFSGVFTPSVLTILGVIMYLRLGWVVGEAGLYWTLAIILLSHVISVSTGLSVSSISTDKRVKAGGIYYILSRSLGLPIGGAIGITLFVGTALSIALYVIGFSESFIDFWHYGSGFQITDDTLQALKPIDSIYNRLASLKGQLFSDKASFVHALKKLNHPEIPALIPKVLEQSQAVSTNDLRITGTITIVSVTTIAFISTSFAIKTQFFILAAIVVSLFSIFLSAPFLFDSIGEYATQQPNLLKPANSESLAEIFGIFFPAVTGFTAGVAMSGDLQDPKKDIPKGTILAIAVGLVVYIALAFFLAFFLENKALRTNSNLLKEIAFGSSWFVIAGIWGATLSSALGGILGAPRILQALSVDKITPKLFAKGVGKSNEPRNALILTFVIAEAGILVGDLNVVARLVSMFYLAAYGFINLSCALESWASSDFRPTFRIPNAISIIGAVSTFFVMVFLDLPFMIAASLIIGLIFFYLTRRQLSLGFGDVWQGVWSSLIRKGLHDMVQKETQQRNWRPNIILFSGAKDTRPHLVLFGKVMAGRLGFLTAFQLIENAETSKVLPKSRQLVPEPEQDALGLFFRRQYCQTIYDGIENIARTYGFSGIEPNTILLGWGGRGSKNPVRFAQSVGSMIELDYNVLLLNYHSQKQFGQNERIDIWWRGAGGNAYLMLMLLKFILSADEWEKAKVRILIANNDNLRRHELHKNCEALREEMRIEAEIRIINNEIEKRPFNEIIHEESENTDLVMLGMPPVIEGQEMGFIERTNSLMQEIDTSVLLVKESSYFSKAVGASETPILIQPIENQNIEAIRKPSNTPLSLPKVTPPQHPDLANLIAETYHKTHQIIEEYCQNYLQKIYEITIAYTLSVRQIMTEQFAKIEADSSHLENRNALLIQTQVEFLQQAQQKINELNGILSQKEQCLTDGNLFLAEKFKELISETPDNFKVEFNAEFFNEDNQELLSHFSTSNQLNVKFFQGKASYQVKYKKLIYFYVKIQGEQILYDNYRLLENTALSHTNSIRRIFDTITNSFDLLERQANNQDFDEVLQAQKEKLSFLITKVLDAQFDANFYQTQLLTNVTHQMNSLVRSLDNLTANQELKKSLKLKKTHRKMSETVKNLPVLWTEVQGYATQIAYINIQILAFRKQLRFEMQTLIDAFQAVLSRQILSPLDDLENYLNQISPTEDSTKQEKSAESLMRNHFTNTVSMQEAIQQFLLQANKLAKNAPKTTQIITEESVANLTFEQKENIETTEISLSKLFDYLIDTYFEPQLAQYERQLNERFQTAKNTVQDIRWLLAFSLEREETRNNLPELISDAHKKATKEINETKKLQKDIYRQIEQIFSNTFEKLSPYSLSKFVDVIEKHERNTSKNTIQINKFSSRVKENVRDSLTNLRYKQSEGELQVRKLTEQFTGNLGDSSILNLTEEVSPDSQTYQTIPLYYKQLFIHKHNSTDEFWFGRQIQLQKADRAYRRFLDGYDSTTAIIGKPDSGKSFLSHYMVGRYFEREKIYTIQPPEAGSTNPRIFEKVLEQATQKTGNYQEILEKLPSNSAIIFHDIELWWERTPDGLAVLECIFEIIDRFASKHFLVFNLNEYAFRMINLMRNSENYFLNIIRCDPFNAQELKEIMLFRHRSSPLIFKLNDKNEQDIPEYEMAGLFMAHFSYSAGNIGTALRSWLRHIEKASEDTLLIRKPISPKNTTLLRTLSSDDCLIILQFLLHKRLTTKKIQCIFQDKATLGLKNIGMLKRIGIIQNFKNEVLILNPYLVPHLITELIRRNILE